MKPVLGLLHHWLIGKRKQALHGNDAAKAIGYILQLAAAVARCLDDLAVLNGNNWVENQIRPCDQGA